MINFVILFIICTNKHYTRTYCCIYEIFIVSVSTVIFIVEGYKLYERSLCFEKIVQLQVTQIGNEQMSGPVTTSKSPTKRFNNGHVCFVAAQQKAFQELLKKEFEKRDRFERLKTQFKMPRNPLVGEPTPREGEGQPLINDYWLEMESPSKHKQAYQITQKIGIDDKRYEFLGNCPTRQNSRAQLVSAGLASLGSPSAKIAQQPSDRAETESQYRPIKSGEAHPQPISSARVALNLKDSRRHAAGTPCITNNTNNVAQKYGDSIDFPSTARPTNDAWENQGNDFYFRIIE